MAVAIYPKVLLDHDVASSLGWIRKLLQRLLKEYYLFYQKMLEDENDSGNNRDDDGRGMDCLVAAGSSGWIPNASLFHATFGLIFQQCKLLGRDQEGLHHNNNHSNSRQKLQQQQQPSKIIGGKQQTVWHDSTHKITSKSMAALDRSKASSNTDNETDSPALQEARAAYLPSPDETPLWDKDEPTLNDDDDDDDNDESNTDTSNTNKWGSSLRSALNQLSGNKILTANDLVTPLTEMHSLLTSKNVASDIATDIVNNVRTKLVGRKLASLTRVKTAVRQALEVTIGRILKPGSGREVDLLRGVVEKRERGNGFLGRFGGGDSEKKGKKPYVIVMIGINGVGKSTSLAKLAYYLTQHKCNPLIAACDTFRSGAVEQLSVHAKCLSVPLYQRGYAKDPASVASDAIAHATAEGHDVVLVDTAGRMQNNVPLMKALSSLVVRNDPDLVLFVCEALVGNDGMDQLSMFNRALRSGGHKREIDGILLTKFDTVSNKVGAALTMTHVTGAPVVFVGTGQKYNHLMKLSTQSVIKSLFA